MVAVETIAASFLYSVSTCLIFLMLVVSNLIAANCAPNACRKCATSWRIMAIATATYRMCFGTVDVLAEGDNGAF